MSLPHVLVVHASAQLYGSDRMLLRTVSVLRGLPADVTVALPDDGPLVAELQRLGSRVCTLDDAGVLKLRYGRRAPSDLAALARAVPGAMKALDACAAGRPVHLVLSHTLAVWAGALWARRRGLRHWWLVHEIVDSPLLLGRLMARTAALLSHRVICNSDATLRWWNDGGGHGAPRRATRIWNAVDPMPAPQPTGAWRPAGARWVVGVVGRLHPGKGQDVLLQAAELLWRRGRRDLALAFVGDAGPALPDYERQLRARVAASPLAGRVALPGFVADRAAVFAELDLVCVPSLRPESFGLVAAEGLAACKPVLAARIGALPEVLGDDAGALHAPGDAIGLAADLERAMDDASWRVRSSQSGHARWQACFAPERHAQALRGLLQAELGLPEREPC